MLDTMEKAELTAAVTELLYREADHLDRQEWGQWLELFTDDAVFWVPSWADEQQTVDDPEQELNLMYIKGRHGLEARAFRFSSGDSYASLPLPKTSHVVGNVRITDRSAAGEVMASAKFLTLALDFRRGKRVIGGWSDYRLRQTPEGLRIAWKKVTLLEGAIDGAIDVYHL